MSENSENFWDRQQWVWWLEEVDVDGLDVLNIPRAQQLLRWVTIWPQWTWAEKWRGCCSPLCGEELGWHNVTWAKAFLGTKWCLDPSSRLATMHQRYRQTDGQVFLKVSK